MTIVKSLIKFIKMRYLKNIIFLIQLYLDLRGRSVREKKRYILHESTCKSKT